MNTINISTTGQEFEYRGQMAATWDLFRGDTSNWDDRFVTGSDPPGLVEALAILQAGKTRRVLSGSGESGR